MFAFKCEKIFAEIPEIPKITKRNKDYLGNLREDGEGEVEYVEGEPRQEENNASADQKPVSFQSSFHFPE